MPPKESFVSYIKSNYDLAGAPLLALVLLVLEKLMETEFVCPNNGVFGIIYTLIFFLSTTLTICILVVPCHCCKFGTRHIDREDPEEGFDFPPDQNKNDCKCGCLCSCCKCIVNFVKILKIPIFWFLILVTDGRYVNCFVESIRKDKGNTTTDLVDFALQISQVSGLLLINILVIVLLCTCETKSKRNRNKHKDIIIQYTQKALEENKKQKLEAFVNQSMNWVEDWDPKFFNAEEKWKELRMKCRKNVSAKLCEEEKPQEKQGGGPEEMSLKEISEGC